MFLLLFLGAGFLLTAQDKQFTLEEIWGGAFRTEGMEALRSMNNGKEYTVLHFDRATGSSSIDRYDYATSEKSGAVVSSADLDIDYFSSYIFSNDEKKLILATQVSPVYRHSALGVYYVYNREDKTLDLISENKIQEPTFSPDGSKVAYVFENNIYIKDLVSGATTQVTTDGKQNAIINGVTDWVYEEEFSFVRAFEWNKTGTRLAYIRFDEREVPEFSMDVYGQTLYPQQQVFKYPKAGENNSVVSLHLYALESGETHQADLGEAYYIPRIKWTSDADLLSVQVLNRHQNHLKLYFYNAEEHNADLVLEENDDAYVDITNDLTFLADNSFIWTSEKDGYNHIYHHKADGTLKRQLTSGNWEVTRYYGFDKKAGRVYYQSVENGSVNRDIYSIRINGKSKKRLSSEAGTNNANFSADFTYFINTFSSATTPYRYTLNDSRSGKVIREIVNNDALSTKLADYAMSAKEFSTLEVNGNDLNMWMIKPVNFDPAQSYPVLMFQYSGPGSQSVANRWHAANDLWYQMLAQKGYIVVCVDGRGTGYKGAAFKKVTYKELGKYEVEDQIEAARILGALPYVDASRMGIWGWSYGGFMSSNAILKGNDVFSLAIAVAPVTSWRFYDTVYTERYMRTPQENASGYDDNSPINHVDKLKGDYLLVHGTADDNVHVQNTMRMVEALVQANKQFDWAIYPDKNHGIYGGKTRLQLYTKMTRFLDEHLGAPKKEDLQAKN